MVPDVSVGLHAKPPSASQVCDVGRPTGLDGVRSFHVAIDCADPAALGAFWAEVLGYVEEPPPEGFDTWPDALTAFGIPEDQQGDAYALVDPEGNGPGCSSTRVRLLHGHAGPGGKRVLHHLTRTTQRYSQPSRSGGASVATRAL